MTERTFRPAAPDLPPVATVADTTALAQAADATRVAGIGAQSQPARTEQATAPALDPAAPTPAAGADAGARSEPEPDAAVVTATEVPVVLYEVDGAIARVTMNRPEFRNAQNSKMTYALDDAFYRAAADPAVKVIILAGAGRHFSAGHDIGTPGRDIDRSFDRRAGLWWDHVGESGAQSRFAREQEVYLGMCRRWRELPKPVIAQVHGACIAGGLMLAWVCDLIVASDDAFFADPVVRMGIPGVEYFAHPWVMGPRAAKEFLFLGERFDAQRALALGMVNRVVPRAELAADVTSIAERIATMPRLGLALTKKAVNQAEDLMGLQTGMDSVFGLHHLAHAHNAEVGADSLAGQDARSMRDARRASESGT
nr:MULTISPECIES: enoyl-CoA hydratase [Pseudofrankia]